MNILVKLYGTIKILGAVTPQGINFNEVGTIEKENLKDLDFDLILVTGNNISFPKVLKQAENLQIDTNKIVMDRTICVPNFTFEKYKLLCNSKLSILSMNCWGGLIYHRFGLPFLSPTINMFTSEKDFVSFLKNSMQNVKSKLQFQKMGFNESLGINYPIFNIGETEWHMNHYSDVSDAENKWIERSSRINWFNLLVVMYTEEPKILEAKNS